MFVRTIQRKSSHRNIAVQIVESYRNDKGQPRQRILRHMGTAPEGEALEQLKRIAHSEMEKMRKYKPLPLLPVTAEASILAADRTDDDDKPIAVSDAEVAPHTGAWIETVPTWRSAHPKRALAGGAPKGLRGLAGLRGCSWGLDSHGRCYGSRRRHLVRRARRSESLRYDRKMGLKSKLRNSHSRCLRH